MADYNFYRNEYMGDAISGADFPRLIKRARDQLAWYRRIYMVEAEEGCRDEKLALCAMAEALYNAEVVANGDGGIQSASIGSVSTSYGNTAAQAVDVTPKGVERALYKAATLYLDIYRGVG